MFLTDTIKGAIWYVGGTSPDGTDSNEIDKFQSGSWNANIGTASTSSSSSTSSDGSVAVMSKYSSGTAHILDSKIFIFGGFSSAGGARSYQSFQSLPWIDVSTATPTIGTQLTLGLVPAQRQDHCSVLTGSEKVIIFGGYDANAKSTFSDIWSLDLVTMTWVEIIPINSARPRYGHNCNLVGANMVVYGGRASGTGNSTGVGYSKDIQVYDIMTATWMDTYTPKKDTTVVSSPLPGGVGSVLVLRQVLQEVMVNPESNHLQQGNLIMI
ncbi:kelch domain-containing protein 3 [Dissophora ornata]|nr:kelch domain-containing protein 3 [Dissophora ornata]